MELTYEEKCSILFTRLNIEVNRIIDEVAVCDNIREVADKYEELAKVSRETADTIEKIEEEKSNDA